MSLLDIKGQQRAITIIEKFIENKSINSSFLFFGRPGIGKHLTALNMAKAINCSGEKQWAWMSDDACVSCKKIENNIHPDVMQITVPLPDESSQMETMVRVIEWLHMPLFEGKQKILIVDDASELNVHAQNAMLKTLEEPLPWVTIIFITSSYARLLPTVQSRLIKVGFNRLSEESIKEILASITTLNKEQLNYLSFLSDGGIKYTAPDDIENDVKKMIALLAELKEPASMVKLAEKFKLQTYKEHFEQIVDIMLSFFIDAVLIQNNPGMIRNEGFQQEITAFSRQFRTRAIINAAASLEKSRSAYELNISPQMIMEHVLFQLTGDNNDD